jgi:hypothetical protein
MNTKLPSLLGPLLYRQTFPILSPKKRCHARKRNDTVLNVCICSVVIKGCGCADLGYLGFLLRCLCPIL